MNQHQVRQRVAEIAASVSDDESAHSAEDALYADVLRHIARDSTDHVAAGLAGEALKTKDLDFMRWCA